MKKHRNEEPIIEMKRKMEVKLIRRTGRAVSWEQAAGTGHTKVRYSTARV
jgi:hypothetical protein